MYICPECAQKLRRHTADQGGYWGCASCGGRFVGYGTLRRLLGVDDAQKLWIKSESVVPRGRPCPSCAFPLRTVPIDRGPTPVEIDVCRPCYTLWFDKDEDQQLGAPSNKPDPLNLPPDQMRTYAEALAQQTRERYEKPDTLLGDAPEETWKWIPALLGLPIEYDRRLLQSPHLTWFLSVIALLLLPVLGASNNDAIRDFGFMGSEPFRHHGITWVSSFFLHAGWMHLLGNLYFFLVFSDDVEDDLSNNALFLMVLFGAHFSGIIGQQFMSGRADIPMVGMSAGVFGILGYYMVRFPKAKVGTMYLFFFKPIWIRWSARWLVLLKIAWELLMAYVLAKSVSRSGSGVAYGAHVGGAFFGIMVGLMVDRLRGDLKPRT